MRPAGPVDIAALPPAVLAAAVLAVDPAALGGAVVRADAASAQAWAELAIALAGGAAPVRRLPLSATADRLCGGLDLAESLLERRPIVQPGLLAEADGGWLALPCAERLQPGVAAEICAALDTGCSALARDGLSARLPARFAALALDEGREAQDRTPAALRERLALHVEPGACGFAAPTEEARAALAMQVALARARLPRVVLPAAAREALCAAAMAVGEPSLRAARFCTSVARILAALEGRPRVEGAHLAAAAALVLAARARHLPQPAEPPAASEPSSEPEALSPGEPPSPAQASPAEGARSRDGVRPDPATSSVALADMTLAAVRAAAPEGVFSPAPAGAATPGLGGGRARGLVARGRTSDRGAPAGVRRARSGAVRRLALVETLKAAAPWQGLRTPALPPPERAFRPRLQVRPVDFRVRVRRPPPRGAVVFVVDASGSAALQRLAEAKGAVERLLADCYARRDQVALVSFRQAAAEVVLPPTRSLTRVRRRLEELKAGGATPLAHAIAAGGRLASAARERGEQPLLVFMSDARANVARSGEQGRAAGAADALAAGRELAGLKLDSVFIDISPRGEAQAGAVAQAMGARYLRLPHVHAEALAQTVRAARDAVGARR